MSTVEATKPTPGRATREEAGAAPSAYPETYRWTRQEYDQLVDAGLLEGKRVELIDGMILGMSPQNSPHYSGIELVARTLHTIFGDGYVVRRQGPLNLLADSEPEPDVAVVPGSLKDYIQSHPSEALLVVEVADSSLPFDRADKSELYASAKIAEYWIVNLMDRCLEVYREPSPASGARFGYRYGSLRTLGPDERIVPLAAPDKPVRVADLLP